MALPAIGMSVPGASDLGLGTMLQDQVNGETEEQRKKRMAQVQQQRFGVGISDLGGMGAGLPGGGLGGFGANGRR